jgi:hypothetical protein
MNGVNIFIDELERFCYTRSMITFLNRAGENFRLELKREAETGIVHYGQAEELKELLKLKLVEGGVVVLRSFTGEIDHTSQEPVKEIRGYVIIPAGDDINHQRLTADDLYWSSNTNPFSGKRIEPEPATRYC